MIRNIIVFIGFDRTGKSEISQALARVFDWTYFKNRNEGLRFDPNENSKLAFKYETQYMCNILEQFRLNGVVLDRSIPCEYAYAKALNRDFDEELVWYYDEKFANLGAKLIYCYKTTFDSFEDEHVKIDLKSPVEKYYEEYLTRTKMRSVRVDTTSHDLVQEFAQIFMSGILFED